MERLLKNNTSCYGKGFLAWRATGIKLGKYRGGFMERLLCSNISYEDEISLLSLT